MGIEKDKINNLKNLVLCKNLYPAFEKQYSDFAADYFAVGVSYECKMTCYDFFTLSSLINYFEQKCTAVI